MPETKKVIIQPKSLTRKIFMYVNLIVCLLIIALAINQYYQVFKKDSNQKLEWGTLDLIIMPFYLILFSSILIMAELNVQFITKSMPFLNTYFGIGMFNIFIASNIGLPSKTSSDFVQVSTIVISYTLFLLGILYSFVFCCVSDIYDAQAMKKKKEQKEKEKKKQQGIKQSQMQQIDKQNSLEENLIDSKNQPQDEESQINLTKIEQETENLTKSEEKESIQKEEEAESKQQEENKETVKKQIEQTEKEEQKIEQQNINSEIQQDPKKQENFNKMFGTSEQNQDQQQQEQEKQVQEQEKQEQEQGTAQPQELL
ncbi:hypothetical protein PPERSA_02510 [Pseudocohnilembus persalinus]|uniref:Transmembrane protein n=1 Tax=Pseudocohnilembus persalinus TaxID=266149 RepID=A0A0V0QAY7_PSEPJ|nr:hypothetical protein PPERSA_02510 [Pseudocohnilembus persalinus]|eukprot:KRW99398.1 hypothetical protein PPERSA_02510 [Pseudocohnilembus persalinus]